MYLGIVLIGATHGLILLPVVLSYIGKDMNTLSSKENNAFEILFQIYCLSFNYFIWRFRERKFKKNHILVSPCLSVSLCLSLSL
jgi:hypothetical protein